MELLGSDSPSQIYLPEKKQLIYNYEIFNKKLLQLYRVFMNSTSTNIFNSLINNDENITVIA